MTGSPSFDEIFAVMSAASLGDATARVPVPADPQLDQVATRFAIALNVLLDDLAFRAAEAKAQLDTITKGGARFSEIVQASLECIITMDDTGVVTEFNPAAEKTFGYPRAEAIGKPLAELIDRTDRKEAQEALRLTQQKTRNLEVDAAEAALRRRGEDRFRDLLEAAPDAMVIVGEDGPHRDQPEPARSAIRDVTDRKRDLEEQNQRMQEANRLKSEFLANMSHELRTPLNAVIGFTALMHGGKAGPLSDVQKEYLGDILTSSRHLLQLINDVLDLAKVESGRVDLKVETVEISKLVNEVKEILRGLAAEKRVRMTVEVDGSLSTVVVDPRMMKQILYNYLSNAIKFTPENGRVTLRIAPEESDSFRLDVEDTGIGIKPEDMNKLFIEFQQLDSGASKKYPGTGLGLALTKRIVEAQGGKVAVKSSPGQGSTFSAILPRRVSQERSKTSRPGPSPE